jgi:sigma-B regulation protein RsbU (phosphoserine phosphatase)
MKAARVLAFSRNWVKSALFAMGIGVVASSFYGVATWPEGFATILFIGAIIGLCIYTAISLLGLAFAPLLNRLGPNGRAAGNALIFVVGGTIGGGLGIVSGVRLLGHPMAVMDVFEGRGIPFMLTAGITALCVGIGFRAFEAMRERLAQTVAHLKEREWAEKELELARAIQSRLLPPAFIEGEGFAIAARNLPARFVAGDFYDVVRLDDGSVLIIVADVAGKGVGASLIMASVKAVLPFVAREGPRRAMSILNAKLVSELGKREFVALVYSRYQPADGSLEVLNAGFPEPYIVSGDGVRALATTGERLPLGLRADVQYDPTHTTLARGERLVFVSDGIPEAPMRGEPLGYDRLAALLGTLDGNAHGETWLEQFLDRVRAETDQGLADDWTAVVVERP